MLSKEDQRRFEQITRHLRETDPAFFARLDQRARARQGRYLMLLTIMLWAALPATTILAGRIAGAVCAVLLVGNAALLWRYRRRWL